MKTLALVGKIDTRIIAYPLARALSILGLTAIISEDGAYRRMCYGDESTGTVSGVDISVGPIMDEELVNSLSKSGVPYDYRILVSGSYIPDGVDGVIVCTGVDRTMGHVEEEEKDEKKEEPRSKRALSKKEPAKEEGLAGDNSENGTESEVEPERVLVESNPVRPRDTVKVPDGIPNKTVIISFDVREKKGVTCIPMRDANIRYLFECDERQELLPIQDKGMVSTIVKLTSELLDIPANELTTAFNRKEYLATGKTK